MEYTFSIPNKKLSSALFFEENNANLFIRKNEVVIVGFDLEKEAKAALDNHNFIENNSSEHIAKLALLERLGITEEEAKLLLG